MAKRKRSGTRQQDWQRAWKRRRRRAAQAAARQREDQWYVPFADGRACIYHGHTDPDDHSLCGPQIFCCPNAARVLMSLNPAAIPPNATWEFTDAEHLITWYGSDVLPVMYFFFCDAADRDKIHFVGLRQQDATGVLRGNIALASLLRGADTITAP